MEPAAELPRAAARVAAATAPSSARVMLYLPLAWLLQLLVSDALHLFLHGCTSLSSSARGWGWGLPGRVLGAVGHIHTVHHQHVDAFGTINRRHKWSSLLLDKLLKRSLTQYLSWKAWCAFLHLDNLLEDFLRLPRTTALGARAAMLLMVRVEALRGALLVGQSALHHWKSSRRRRQQRVRCGEEGDSSCPVARVEDHPPLGRLPLKAARRLAASIAAGDPQSLLQWRVFTSPVAHSLHHYHVWNFPFQVVDWRALVLLLRGARLEWAGLTHELGWSGLIELPANSRRTPDGLEPRYLHAVSPPPPRTQ